MVYDEPYFGDTSFERLGLFAAGAIVCLVGVLSFQFVSVNFLDVEQGDQTTAADGDNTEQQPSAEEQRLRQEVEKLKQLLDLPDDESLTAEVLNLRQQKEELAQQSYEAQTTLNAELEQSKAECKHLLDQKAQLLSEANRLESERAVLVLKHQDTLKAEYVPREQHYRLKAVCESKDIEKDLLRRQRNAFYEDLQARLAGPVRQTGKAIRVFVLLAGLAVSEDPLTITAKHRDSDHYEELSVHCQTSGAHVLEDTFSLVPGWYDISYESGDRSDSFPFLVDPGLSTMRISLSNARPENVKTQGPCIPILAGTAQQRFSR